MKQLTISIKDEAIIDAISKASEEIEVTIDDYIEKTLSDALKAKLGYKLIAYYSDGTTHEETDFYTDDDIYESIDAYYRICKSENPICGNKILTGFKAYQHNKLLVEY